MDYKGALERLTRGDEIDYQDGCSCPNCFEIKPAFDLAVKALAESVKRQDGCDKCMGWRIKSDHIYKFCPDCGKELKDEVKT